MTMPQKVKAWMFRHIVFSQVMSVVSLVVLWSVTPVLAQSVQHPMNVPQETITISLPIYIISLLSTAAFTWTVAKYQSSRDQQVQELRQQVQMLTQILKTHAPDKIDSDILTQGFKK
jgi:hypothetical protein